MELFWTPEAIHDRDDIYEYIETDNPAAALSLDEFFSARAAHLLDHPDSGRVGRVNRHQGAGCASTLYAGL
jgi:plasmid stabilization system protein ParE